MLDLIRLIGVKGGRGGLSWDERELREDRAPAKDARGTSADKLRANLAKGRAKRLAMAEERIVAALREIGHPASALEIGALSGHKPGGMLDTLSRIESIYGIAGINARGCHATYWWIRGVPVPHSWNKDRREKA